MSFRQRSAAIYGAGGLVAVAFGATAGDLWPVWGLLALWFAWVVDRLAERE